MSKLELQVEAVHMGMDIAVMSDGSTLPITDWLDADGDDCEAAEASYCVAGEDGIGWWSIDLSYFGAMAAH